MLGDRMLARLVPQMAAHAACTPAEHVCQCMPDVDGEYSNCWWEQFCNGQYREWGFSAHKGC
ncbi:hypothetical protein [Pseudonocardia sp. GCM10023141]|uniref:hypothetical protein n=1 Tax=Pseudonocardia sp. GCM10023141 TaxID=3252653 RepID=UPI0036146345